MKLNLRRLMRAGALTFAAYFMVPTAAAQPTPETPADAAPPAAPDVGSGMVSLAGKCIERIEFAGNRIIESDAIAATLISEKGKPLELAKLREDIRAIWRMGQFADVSVSAELVGDSLVLTYEVRERPLIHKVFISGNSGVGLEAINEVIDLKLDTILDVAAVKTNRDRIAALYRRSGFYLSSVSYATKAVNDAEVDVYFEITEQTRVEVREVLFIGNNAVPDAELRGIIATRRPTVMAALFGKKASADPDAPPPPGVYDESALSRDLQIIQAHYWDKGYAEVAVGEPQLRLSRDKRYMYVAIPINEGPIYSFGEIKFSGELLGDVAEHHKRIGAKVGAQFSRAVLAADRERVAAYYMDQGYAYANVNPNIETDPKKRLVKLSYDIERGKKVFVERINIRGNSKTRDKVIRREMTLSEGDLYSATKQDISRRRIQALGYFEDERVQISTSKGSNDEFIVLDVEVAERSTGTFQIGAGFSSDEAFILQAQIADNNMMGRGQAWQIQAQVSGQRQILYGRFQDPYFLDSQWTLGVDLYNQSRGFGSFARNALGGSLTLGYPLSYEARTFLTWRAEDVSVTTGGSGFTSFGASRAPVESSTVANLYRGGFTSSLRAAFSWDSRNNRLFPSKGWYHNIFVEVAEKVLLSDNVFVRYGGFSRYYRRLGGPFVLKLNAEVGVTTSRDPLGVPITERYLVGGINDIRGFGLRELGPRLRTSRPGDPGQGLGEISLGGNLQMIWNSEIEFPLLKQLGVSGVVFFDAGNAYNLEDRYCSGLSGDSNGTSIKFDPCFSMPKSLIDGIRTSAGFGFRWQSPIGPLRFEWGIPLDRQPSERPILFEFTIGNFL
ncbi:MAG: outer membrane protein assembly factor BamA [Myxococcales bacterium]|nr:outer membrane protein assembly factor BamA [Myxococcales bacterium]